MLPRTHRLRHAKEIHHVLRRGQLLTTPCLRIYSHPSAAPLTRIACVVSKSVHQSAVRRHQYQRWLRELAQYFLLVKSLPHPYDMVWVAQPGIRQFNSLAELRQEMSPRWEKLRTTLI